MAAAKTYLTVFGVVLLCVLNTHAELFTALADLERTLHAEHAVAKDLRHYINMEEERISRLKAIADDFETHSVHALENTEKYLSNPINTFLLVKRFTSDWDNIVNNYIRSNATEVFLESVGQKTSDFPGEDDLQGAAAALMRLQDTYDLPTDKLSRGDIQGITDSPVLSADECFELGRHAYNRKDYYHTVLWMSEALNVLHGERDDSVQRVVVLDYLAFAMSMQGNIHKALNLTKEWLLLEPDHVRAQNNLKYFEQQVIELEDEKRRKGDTIDGEAEIINEKPFDDYRSSEEFSGYEALCRDEEPVVVYKKHHLYCQYKRHKPMFYINPLREELMSFDPWIVIYHQAMTDSEIAKVKELATPRLSRATVQNPQTGVLEFANYRVSKSAWLKDFEDPLINRISVRTGGFTNLTLETVEELQVVNYGIGGHYEPHYDFARKDELTSFRDFVGNRILTAIFYMSDVAAGGFTVFPQLGVKLKPEKGACAVWYNLKADGEGDYSTRHAACPVLTGNKWVCNKWFHERGNEFRRPCDLSPNE